LYQNNPEKQEEIGKIVNILKEQVVRGSHLVSNITQLSEIEEDKLILESIDAAKVLQDAIKIVQEGFQTRIIDVNVDSPGDNLLVQANDLLLNVFENILNNAVKYNDHPIVEIIIRITEQYEDGVNYLKIEFMDNGIGIDDFKKATIFKEGYKKEKGAKGLGFGLSLVKKIIAGYKARIWVEDKIIGNYEKGSNFVLLIPRS
jgi:signal transduction histidine kinase